MVSCRTPLTLAADSIGMFGLLGGGPSGQNWALGFAYSPAGGEPELSARSSCWKKQTFTPRTWKGKVLTLSSFYTTKTLNERGASTGRRHPVCWNLAHFGI